MQNSTISNFSKINTIEGYSYIILVFIAMPLKYIFNLALAVKIVGSIHGVLFIVFCLLLYKASLQGRWKIDKTIIFFIASLIPFGTFYTKKIIDSYVEL